MNYPFPQSNIHTVLGYTSFIQNFIRFFRLWININDFLFRVKLSYSKLIKRGYMHSHFLKYFKRFCLTYKIDEKHIEKNYNLLFSRMIKYRVSVSCDINNVTEVNAIVKTRSMKITIITSNFKDICINKPPLATEVFEDINTDIDDIEGSNSYSLKDIAKCSTLPCENIPPFVL